MRFALVILVTILLSLGASWLLWHDELDPVLPPAPVPRPTAVQREFGWRVSGQLAAALDQPLPARFTPATGFAETVSRLHEASGVKILVNWRNLESRAIVSKDTPVEAVDFGGMK